jgi:hypothetical protein
MWSWEGYEARRVADLRRAGWGRAEIERCESPTDLNGVRVVSEAQVPEREARIAQALAVAPTGGVLSGWAAAAVWGVPASFLDGTHDGDSLVPVDFSVPRDEGTYRRVGLKVRYSPVPAEDVAEVDGLRLTSPRRTAFDLARWARTEARALAMLDLSMRHGLVTPGELAAYVRPLRRLHGLRRVRAALPEMCDRAESVPESELRWHWLSIGLPRPLANVKVHDRFGVFVGRIDLLDPFTGFGAEYQGFWHGIDGAREADAHRFQRFAAMNLHIAEIWKEDVSAGRATGKLRDAWHAAQARDHRLDAWRCPGVADL